MEAQELKASAMRNRWVLSRFPDDELEAEEGEVGVELLLSDAEVVALKLVLATSIRTYLDGDDLDRQSAAIRQQASQALAKISALLRAMLPREEAGGK